MSQYWQFWANTGAALQPAVTQAVPQPGIMRVTTPATAGPAGAVHAVTTVVPAGQPLGMQAHLATAAAAGCLPPVTLHYGTDLQGNRYTAMTSTVTAQASWGIQYIARTYGGDGVTVRGLTWRLRPLTMGELAGGAAG